MKIALIDPKYPHNVAGAVRAASCFGVQTVAFSGNRVAEKILEEKRIPREERMIGYSDVELINPTNPIELLGGTPVAVEFLPNSECLFDFDHPEDATYIFGPEDGTLGRSVLARCHRFIKIPTRHCLNLYSAVSMILYDRALKEYWNGGSKPTELDIEPVDKDRHMAAFVTKVRKMLETAK